MTADPLISVVVPVYNTEPYLRQCLDSLVGQTYRNLEIVCVNDGSTDGSLAVLREYEGNDARVRVVSQENAGLSGARNAGLDVAAGDYLMFVDSDDWVDADMCERMLAAARETGADCVMCSYAKEFAGRSERVHVFRGDVCWRGEEVQGRFRRRLFGPVGEETRAPHEVDLPTAPWMQIFSAEAARGARFVSVEEVGTGEDLLYQVEVYARCRCLAYVDVPLYHYRKTNDGSVTASYKPYLFDRWQNLYRMLEETIGLEGLPGVFREALDNRICFGIIGLGLNEANAPHGLRWKARRLRHIVSHERYRRALSHLDTRHMPPHWRAFFAPLRRGHTMPAALMLEGIQALRRAR